MDAARCSHSAKIEAEGRHAHALSNFGDTDHYGIVHVAPVEGVGVADDQAGLGALR
jgi:hypothetical protein